MEVNVLDILYEYPNNKAGVKQLFAEISKQIKKTDYRLVQMKIDEEMVYSDYQQYIEHNLANIKVVDVELATLEQWGLGIVADMHQYLLKVLPGVRMLIEELYRGGNEKAWKSFSDFIEGFEWIISVANALQSANVEQGNVREMSDKLSPLFKEIVQIMENKDTLQLADLIHYEILPLLTTLSIKLTNVLERAGYDDSETK